MSSVGPSVTTVAGATIVVDAAGAHIHITLKYSNMDYPCRTKHTTIQYHNPQWGNSSSPHRKHPCFQTAIGTMKALEFDCDGEFLHAWTGFLNLAEFLCNLFHFSKLQTNSNSLISIKLSN